MKIETQGKTTREIGFAAETVAMNFLKKQGLRFKERNFSYKNMGELDLIMYDKETLVFVEVRMRSRQDYGSAAESIDQRKKSKLLRIANFYLMTHGLYGKIPCRFDVIDVSFQDDENHVEWFQNAILEKW